MKKIFALILTVLMILMPIFVMAEDDNHVYSVSSFPAISMIEVETPFHVDVIPVELAWSTVYSDETLHAYLVSEAVDCENVVDIMLTDTLHVVHANIDVISNTMLRMTFNTEIIRYFTSENTIYLFVVYTDSPNTFNA